MSGPWDEYAPTEAPPAEGPWSSYKEQSPQPKGLDVPDKVPPALLERLTRGTWIDNTIKEFGAAIPAFKETFGKEPLGLSVEHTKELQDIGIFPDHERGLGGPIRFANQAMIQPVASLADAVFRGINGGVHGIAAMIGKASEIHGGSQGDTERAKAEATNFMNYLMLRGDHTISRIDHGPGGAVHDQQIGILPRSEDFSTASEIVGGDKAPMAVQEKMLATYNERGLHPSELAHDAQTDPIVAQSLLSSDKGVLPGIDDGHTLAGIGDGSWYKFNERDIELPPGLEKFRKAMSEKGFESDVADHFYRDITGKEIDIADQFGIGKSKAGDIEVPTLADDLHDVIKEFKVEPTSLEPKEQLPPREGSVESAKQELSSRVSVGESQPKAKLTLDKLYTQAVDDLHPLKKADEEGYQLARLTRGQFGKAEHFLEHGTFDFNTYETNGKGLTEILDPVKKDLGGLRTFLVAKRSMEIEDSGRITGIDYSVARQVAAAGEKQYAKIAEQVVDYQSRVLRYLKDSGVLSDKAFDAMLDAGKNYIPFYRVMGDETAGKGAGSSLGPSNPVKKLKGSERVVIDPLESIIKNTYAYVSIAERNAAGLKFIDALKRDGAEVTATKTAKDAELVQYLRENGVKDPEAIVDFVKSAPEGGDTLGAFRDGVKETVKVNDPELVKAFRGLDKTSADLLTRILAVPAKSLRAGATLSPDFIVRNIMRDFSTAFVNSGRGLFTPIDTVKGLVGVIRKDSDFLDWMKGGGANATMVSLDRQYMQESLRKLSGETGLMDRGWNVITSPIRGLRMVSELAENATRLAEFKKMTGEGKAAIQNAAFASREVTLDFSRIGASMRAYNMITAFGNAQIQGLDRIGRAFVDRPTNTTMKIAGGITMPSVLLWYANHDDPRYQELPAYQKDLFWIVMTKDHIYRIPKPFELGVVFGSGVERILDATVGKNPEAFANFAKSVQQVITPNFIPTAVQPLIEQWANRSSFSDRTLIPADQEKHLPEYQYTPYTTELAKSLGKIVSAFPGMRSTAVGPGAPFGPVARAVTSPILMENYIRSWTGGLGTYALNAADAGLRKAGVLPDPVTPTPTLADIPIVKAFIVRYPSATTQSIQDFYDQHETTKKFYDTWMAKAQEGDGEAMARIQQAGGPGMFLRLDAIKETLSEHSKLVRDIYKNPTMEAPEKRQLIDGLYFNMIEIAKAGKQMIREGEKALDGEKPTKLKDPSLIMNGPQAGMGIRG